MRKGSGLASRYLVVLISDRRVVIRVSDHAAPRGRGGMKEGALDYYDEADVSLDPGTDSIQKVSDLIRATMSIEFEID